MNFTKKNLITLIVGALIVSTVIITVPIAVHLRNIKNKDILIEHDPILIWKDDDFNQYKFPGEGTENKPYIIENYNITTSFPYCITIWNTTKHVIIRNCFFHSVVYSIYINDVSNNTVTIIGNTFTDVSSNFDIHVVNSPGSKIVDNKLFDIFLFNSEYSTIIGNSGFSDKSRFSIVNSGYSLIENNTFTSCRLYIRYSSNTIIKNNTFLYGNVYFDGNAYFGNIDLEKSNNCIIRDNTLYGGSNWGIGQKGISISKSRNTIVVNNTGYDMRVFILLEESEGSSIKDNTYYGENVKSIISLTNSNSSQIRSNTLFNCNFQIYESTIENYLTNTIENNFVNSKPFVFLTNLIYTTFSSFDYGQALFVNCSNIKISNIIVENSSPGISFCLCDNVTVENSTFSNSGIWSYLSSNILIVNNTFFDNFFGIFLEKSRDPKISNNVFHNNEKGIYLIDTSNSIILNNTCSSNREQGIFLDNSCNSTIVDNNCTNNDGTGIILIESSNSTIANNTCNNNSRGIHCFSNDSNLINNTCNYNRGIGILHLGKNSILANNTCTNNGDDGIDCYGDDSILANNSCNYNGDTGIFYEGSNSTLTNNTCTNNGDDGIFMHKASSCVVSYNLLQDNGLYGIYMFEESNNNIIHHNAFINNNPTGFSQAFDSSVNNTWYDETSVGGNFWSDWISGFYSIDGSANAFDIYPLLVNPLD